MMQTAYGINQYKKNDVEGASPIRLVVMAYDLAILSCEKQDIDKAVKAVEALRRALDFDYPEAAGGLLALYQWVLECLRKNDFEAAKNILLDLREAWAMVEKKLNSAQNIVVMEDGKMLFDEETVDNESVAT
jgi:flagellin-specific chaperone FliS